MVGVVDGQGEGGARLDGRQPLDLVLGQDAAVRQAHQAGAGFGGGVDDSVQDDAGVFHGGSDRGRIQAACRRLASEPTPAMRIS